MVGGEGRDTFGFRFDYHVINEGVTIADFDQSLHERIDLSAIDPKPQAAGDQKFHFLGTADFINDKPGQVRYQVINDQTFITMTLDGRPGADATIVLDGVFTLTAHDFIL